MKKLLNCYVIIAVATLVLSGCASLSNDFKQPKVALNHIKLLNSNKLMPEFELGLHVINPNDIDLDLRGVSYTIAINDKEIITGVSNKLPVIEAYGEDDITLVAKANLFSSLELIGGIFENSSKDLTYTLDVELDVGSLYPNINITRSGQLSELITKR